MAPATTGCSEDSGTSARPAMARLPTSAVPSMSTSTVVTSCSWNCCRGGADDVRPERPKPALPRAVCCAAVVDPLSSSKESESRVSTSGSPGRPTAPPATIRVLPRSSSTSTSSRGCASSMVAVPDDFDGPNPALPAPPASRASAARMSWAAAAWMPSSSPPWTASSSDRPAQRIVRADSRYPCAEVIVAPVSAARASASTQTPDSRGSRGRKNTRLQRQQLWRPRTAPTRPTWRGLPACSGPRTVPHADAAFVTATPTRATPRNLTLDDLTGSRARVSPGLAPVIHDDGGMSVRVREGLEPPRA